MPNDTLDQPPQNPLTIYFQKSTNAFLLATHLFDAAEIPAVRFSLVKPFCRQPPMGFIASSRIKWNSPTVSARQIIADYSAPADSSSLSSVWSNTISSNCNPKPFLWRIKQTYLQQTWHPAGSMQSRRKLSLGYSTSPKSWSPCR